MKNKYTDTIDQVIEYLNVVANRRFKKNVPKTRKFIKARLEEGFIMSDFMVVIDLKVKQWNNDTVMAKYIRPETLFGTKFEGYVNEADIKIGEKYGEFNPNVYD